VLSLPTSKSTSDTFYTLYIPHGCLIPTDGQPFFVAFLEQINLICLPIQLDLLFESSTSEKQIQ